MPDQENEKVPLPEIQPTIAVDFDGTITWSPGWFGENHFGTPIKGARTALKALREMGWKIVISTCRERKDLVAAFLDSQDIPFDEVYNGSDGRGKAIAHVYLDDRAVIFDGNWGRALESVIKFSPWYCEKDARKFIEDWGSQEDED